LEKGVKEGRDGKGVIYVFAAGNSYGNGDNVNYQAYPKSRFVMTVGAIKLKDIVGNGILKPIHSSYSTSGSSIFVVAPGGDYDSPYQHVGAGGNEGTGDSCVNIGIGTSFATPVVGGVVALMLEANEGLTWRDVRAIIAETSKPIIIEVNDETTKNNNDDATFGINAAGVGYSELYGFGIIDAKKAVSTAKKWNTEEQHVPPELDITVGSGVMGLGLGLQILDDVLTTTTSTITIYDTQKPQQSGSDKDDYVSTDTLESVSVYLKLRYFNR